MILCKCGCGQEITRKPRPDRPNVFIHGHHRRGTKLSEKSKEKISKSHIGKKLSKTHIIKMSRTLRRRYRTGELVNPWKDKHQTPEMLAKFRETIQNKKDWKGRSITTEGYVLIYKPTHPFPVKRQYVLEHRFVMEQHIGRYLKSEEIVHHLDQVKTNNNIDNLLLLPNKAAHMAFHKRLRNKGKFI